MSLYPVSEMGKLHIPAPESGQWTNLVLNSELKPSGGLFFWTLGCMKIKAEAEAELRVVTGAEDSLLCTGQ